jgi:hypothetical protein
MRTLASQAQPITAAELAEVMNSEPTPENYRDFCRATERCIDKQMMYAAIPEARLNDQRVNHLLGWANKMLMARHVEGYAITGSGRGNDFQKEVLDTVLRENKSLTTQTLIEILQHGYHLADVRTHAALKIAEHCPDFVLQDASKGEVGLFHQVQRSLTTEPVVVYAICKVNRRNFAEFVGHANRDAATSERERETALADKMQSVKAGLSDLGIPSDGLFVLHNSPRSQLLGMTVRAEEALQLRENILSLMPRTGLYPVIVGNERDVQVRVEQLNSLIPGSSIERVLLKARSESPEYSWKRLGERYDEEIEAHGAASEEDDASEQASFTQSVTTPDASDLGFGEVAIALLPVRETWKIPAVLGFAGEHDQSESEVHCAVLKQLDDRYGLDIVNITPNAIDVKIRRSPEDDVEALNLAKALSIYLHINPPDISAFAKALRETTEWHFQINGGSKRNKFY